MLRGGRLDFVDESVHKNHALRELNLAVPFLSNLASKREIKTTPRLAFQLNSSTFDTAAEGTPFARTRKTDASLTLRNLDLKPYLAYLPASFPFRLQGALLNVDAKVAFEETPAAVVRISGTVTADKVSLLGNQAPGSELLKFDRLKLTLDDVRRLEQLARLSAVELTARVLSIARNRAGQLNLLPAANQGATKNIASNACPEAATGSEALVRSGGVWHS